MENSVVFSVAWAAMLFGCSAPLVGAASDAEPAFSASELSARAQEEAARFPVDVRTTVEFGAFERLVKTAPSFPFGKVERDVDPLGEVEWLMAMMRQVDEFNIQMNLIRMHNRLLQKSMNVIQSGSALNQSQAALAVLNAVSKHFIETLDVSSSDGFQ